MKKVLIAIFMLTVVLNFEVSAQAQKGILDDLNPWSVDNKFAKLEKESPVAASEKTEKNWAIMVYGCLDIEKQLESALLTEIMDIAAYGNCGGQVHIIAQIDFMSEKKKESRRYYITKDSLNVRAKMANLNTGDPSNFKNFLEWAMSYPAKHRMLYINGHGTGWISGSGPGSILPDQKSFGYDLNSKDCITLLESTSVLEQVLNGGKLDILAFRSCLMDQAETSLQFSRFFNYMVASETSQVGVAQGIISSLFGLQTHFDPAVLDLLSSAPASSPLNVAKAMYDSVRKTNQKVTEIAKFDFQMSCLDLNEIPKLVPGMKKISELLTAGLDSANKSGVIAAVTSARTMSPKFGGIFEGIYETKPDDYEYVDLGSFLTNLTKTMEVLLQNDEGRQLTAQVKEAAASVIEALNTATIAKANPCTDKGSYAVDFFLLPPKEKMVKLYSKLLEPKYQQIDFCQATGWDIFLHKYYGLN
ncbi:MAG: clostripain-related cysteine peptidase [Candidatus Wallbacteria bacterium]|nr:clostripain-related cysteine peptidase [Candidatus Wallbacteria bacterium]